VDAMRPVQQYNYAQQQMAQYPPIMQNGPTAPNTVQIAAAYPSLTDFMGLELTEEMIRLNMPEYLPQIEDGTHGGNQVATRSLDSCK